MRAVTVASIACLAAAGACTSGPPPPVDTRPYDQQVLAFRAEKDEAFRVGADSPIPEAARATFTGLAYYPVDPAYRVPASLAEDRSGPPSILELQTSTDQRRKMRRVGSLTFTLGEASYKLTAFADLDAPTMNRLFVPFADLTSGDETYRGGRYLELDRTPTGLYDLDFNRAYHPFCVYNSTYDCPIPPRENRLPVAIRAGERLASPK
ncbi:MAG TPA: DUF1684 domain-containing protein [Vicinamibacterales bacterium]|nr:DUF1684 domain-containing protein [Vicinamibacterales bacterium]